MKKINLYVLMVLLNTIVFTGFSQKRIKKNPLEITGAALLNDARTKNYSISIYLDGSKVDSIYTKSKSSLSFFVDYNHVYTFLFQKQDCKDKIVIVNTTIPEGLKGMKDDIFDFEIEMSQSLAKNTNETEDYPVAVLSINKEEEQLMASEAYYKFTHQEWEVTTLNVTENSLIKESKKIKNKAD
ncbi:MAG: hypothetical protein V4677_14935 [Bacteroidota bacterium]